MKLFSDRQLDIDPKVPAFAAPRLERTFAAAADLVDRLDRLSLEERRRVTVPLTARVLSSAGDTGDA